MCFATTFIFNHESHVQETSCLTETVYTQQPTINLIYMQACQSNTEYLLLDIKKFACSAWKMQAFG